MSFSHLHKPVREVDGLSLYYIDTVAVIVMNRGDNRLNIDFFSAFNELLDLVESNKNCNGLITTGVGKFYSNGIDLKWMSTQSKEVMNEFFSKLYTLLKRMTTFCVPTVAAINGHAFAGGAFLAFAHDLRIMRNDGRGWICFNEVNISMRFSTSMRVMLRQKMGTGQNLQNALVLGHRFTAEEAFSAGWLHTITPESVMLKQAAQAIKRIHGKHGIPRESLFNMKTDVYEIALEAFDKQITEYPWGSSKL